MKKIGRRCHKLPAYFVYMTNANMDREKFKSTIVPLYRKLYAVAFAILGNSDDAADIVQEAYAMLWVQRDRLDGVLSPLSFATTVVKRKCIDALREKRHQAGIVDTSVFDNLQQPPADVEGKDKLDLIRKLLNNLYENQRQVISLSSFGGMSNDEIAETLGISNSNVRQLLSRARKQLTLLLNNYEYKAI